MFSALPKAVTVRRIKHLSAVRSCWGLDEWVTRLSNAQTARFGFDSCINSNTWLVNQWTRNKLSKIIHNYHHQVTINSLHLQSTTKFTVKWFSVIKLIWLNAKCQHFQISLLKKKQWHMYGRYVISQKISLIYALLQEEVYRITCWLTKCKTILNEKMQK